MKFKKTKFDMVQFCNKELYSNAYSVDFRCSYLIAQEVTVNLLVTEGYSRVGSRCQGAARKNTPPKKHSAEKWRVRFIGTPVMTASLNGLICSRTNCT